MAGAGEELSVIVTISSAGGPETHGATYREKVELALLFWRLRWSVDVWSGVPRRVWTRMGGDILWCRDTALSAGVAERTRRENRKAAHAGRQVG